MNENQVEVVQITKWVSGVHQSRWGYHPCSYETFCKLKQLAVVVQKADRICHQFQRWFRKSPRNRVARPRIYNDNGWVIGYGDPVSIPEPRQPSRTLVVKRSRSSRVDVNGTIHDAKVSVKRLKLTMVAQVILDCRAIASKPKPSQDKVTPLLLSELDINRLYDELVSAPMREQLLAKLMAKPETLDVLRERLLSEKATQWEGL